jgi:uncharacterized protein (TIGR00369 family)
MDLAAVASRFVPRVDRLEGNFVRSAWDRLHRLPGGKRVFSRLVGAVAPYTGSIGATVVELGPGFSRVTMRDRRAVRQHLGSVHAIALANLAELTGNVAVAYTLPDDARFIVAGMSLEYLKKARGTLTGACDLPPLSGSERREIEVAVQIRDAGGDVVTRATLRTLVGPKRS